jgi:Zn-dependent peptidase ImmA (M78 family)
LKDGARIHKAAFYRGLYKANSERRSRRKAQSGEIRRRVAGLLTQVRYTGPPTNLGAIARQLQVENVRTSPLSMRGRVVVERGLVVVEVNEDLAPVDRRYVLAHELSHLILEGERFAKASSVGHAVKQDVAWKFRLTEDLCDQAAAELLLPTDWLLANQPKTLAAAVETANRAEISIDVLAPRLVDIGIWKGDRLWWLSTEPPYRLLRSHPGWDDDFIDRVSIGPRSVDLIRSCSARADCQVANIDAEIVGESVTYEVEAIALKGSAVLARLLVGDNPR